VSVLGEIEICMGELRFMWSIPFRLVTPFAATVDLVTESFCVGPGALRGFTLGKKVFFLLPTGSQSKQSDF
jgi:hypothetical protein